MSGMGPSNRFPAPPGLDLQDSHLRLLIASSSLQTEVRPNPNTSTRISGPHGQNLPHDSTEYLTAILTRTIFRETVRFPSVGLASSSKSCRLGRLLNLRSHIEVPLAKDILRQALKLG